MTEQNTYRGQPRDGIIDGITLELAITIAKHGKVHRMRYTSAVGLLKQQQKKCLKKGVNLVMVTQL